MKRHVLILVLALSIFGAACGRDKPAASGEQGRLDEARGLWENDGPRDYQMEIRDVCFCPPTLWIETVVNGEVTSHESGEEVFFDPGPRTMEDLFDAVQEVIDAGYATLEVNYDETTGAAGELFR